MSSSFRTKRSWLAPLSVVALIAAIAFPATSFADNASGCDFAATGTTQSCLPPLTGSTFAGADGNLLTNPTTFGTTDWQNVAGLHTGIDLASGSGDNSFGQGTKEDNANVTVVSGSIPPQKSDLTRFYEASETGSNGHVFLYLAWERTNTLGSANMDFEINKLAQPSLTTPGAKTLNRSPGDLLVTFDFTNGGGRPTLGLNRWLVSATNPVVPGFATNVCLSSNSFPCWGDHAALTGSVAIGAVNNLDAVTDPNLAGTNNVGVSRFGETAIDLTNSGVFGTGTCTTFASTFLKSRASNSFPAEVKDFVAPVSTSISNCGTLIVKKVTVPDPDPTDTSFGFTVDGANPPNANLPKTFSLKNGESNSTTVFAGNSFSAAETVPANWSLTSATCDNGSGSLSAGTISGITVGVDETVTCTFTNTLQLGALEISKTSIKGPTALPGATFSITGPGGYSNSVQTGPDGTVCVDGLTLGTYSVQETAAPPGYDIDDTTAHNVSVSASSTCGDGNEATFSATDTPLTDISASATSQVSGAGGTQSTITCVDGSSADVGNSPQGPDQSPTVSATDLHPGTYTCTIFIDP